MKKLISLILILLLINLCSGCNEIDDNRAVTGGIIHNNYEPDETDISKAATASFMEDSEATASETITAENTTAENATTFSDTETETISKKSEDSSEIIGESTVKKNTSAEQPLSDNTGYKNIGESGILVMEINGRIHALMPCGGTYTLCDRFAKNLNDFAERLPDINVYSMIIPTSVEFYLPSGNEGFTASQLNKINYVTEELKNVTNIDAYGALRRHAGENIYARTDHHWLPLGAYYAAKIFSETAGFPFITLEEYQKVVKSGYVGSMYNYTEDLKLYNDPEDFVMYLPPDTGKTVYYDTAFENGYESELFLSPDGGAYYCSFLGSDQIIAEIKTNAGTGRILVIFKDSFGNALAPFLTSGFDVIYVCDIRYFDLNAIDFCKKVEATDLLFAVCTYTCAGENGNYLDLIK